MSRKFDTHVRTIVPPYIFDNIIKNSNDKVAQAAAKLTLAETQRMRIQRSAVTASLRTLRQARAQAKPFAGPAPPLNRAVYTASHTGNLPGTSARTEGQAASADGSVNRCYDDFGATFNLYETVFGRNSIDGVGMKMLGSVHYMTGYNNAFWNGSQMVFGDGDGVYFNDFTSSVDVIGHELTHGVTQFTAGLEYSGQSGALNESISDVFGSMVKQYSLNQTSGDADWLIGAGLFTSKVKGKALRSMKDPGTAYDDPNLGRDPQPNSMVGYVNTTADNGGVHINSGIPNRAFCLFALSLGGHSWDQAGKVWYATLTDNRLSATASFYEFANLTIDNANTLFGAEVANALINAWSAVAIDTKFAAVYAQGDPGGGIGGYDLKSPDDLAFAFDYDKSGRSDHVALYRPGTGTIWILANNGGVFTPVYAQGDPGGGIGGYDLKSKSDRAFAFDYDHSGRADHLALYRPATGTIWILRNDSGAFTPVYAQGDPGSGIGGYDLKSAADQAFAFDYDHSGKLDHIALYRPGTGTMWILKNDNGNFSPVYAQGDPGGGIGGYDLKSPADHAFAFDYDHSGKLDHIALYRPATGTMWILANNGGAFSPVYAEGDPGNGIGGYDLKSPSDRAFAFDYDHSGRLDHVALYRPGTGTMWILQNNSGSFSPVQAQGDPGGGIGGYDLRSGADRSFAFDYDKSGRADHVALYRPGTGTMWILRRQW